MAAADLLNYDDLKASVALWLNRRDLTDMIPSFIRLAEAQIRRVTRRHTVRATLDVDSEVTALPADCAVLRSITPRTSEVVRDRPWANVTPEVLAERRALHAGAAGRPKYFTVVNGRELITAPVADQSYECEILYYKRLSPLSSNTATNEIFAEAPDVYLYGALLEAAPYLKNDERVELWQMKFDRAISQLNHVREEEERSASISPARLPVTFG